MFAALARYADFNGRGSRSEYWLFFVLLVAVFTVALVLDLALFRDVNVGEDSPLVGPLTAIVFLGFLIPSYSATVRRLHDTNRSGWWMFIYLVPLIGPIIQLVYLCQPGDPRPNRFGIPPRETPDLVNGGNAQTYENRKTAPQQSPSLGSHDSFRQQTGTTPFSPPAPKPTPNQSDDTWMDRLEKMAKLRDQGILTDEEFATEKAALLSSLK